MIDSLVSLLGLQAHDPLFWMPLAFMLLFFAIVVAGTVLDGFDIGVGWLLPFATPEQRMRMLALLSPWRDANEFWLLLGLTLLVTAFPLAWESIMGQLYVPLAILGLGIFMRSAAFELRLRAPVGSHNNWALVFALGSWLTALAHGYLLGQIVTGYEQGPGYMAYSSFLAVCAVAAYCLLGGTWLMMREPGDLRICAAYWGRQAVRWAAAGAVAVSLVLAFANTGVFLRWTAGSQWLMVILLWIWILVSFMAIEMILQRSIHRQRRHAWVPFFLVLFVFLITLGGLGYSFFPYLVLDNITIWDAAASLGALRLILAATVIALPVALIFNIWVYWGMFGVSRPPQPPPFRRLET